MALNCAPPLLNLNLKLWNKHRQTHFRVAKRSDSVSATVSGRNALLQGSQSRSILANDDGFRMHFVRAAAKPNLIKVIYNEIVSLTSCVFLVKWR